MLVVVAEVTPMMVAHVVVVGSWILCGGAHEITSLWSCEKGHDVLIQGGVIDDVARHLVEQYGVPKRYFEILDKTKK
uniref:SUI1 domain-containing protein n=1 Tax=Populus trichocarpa TaxID=3694 RepID=U7E1I6_POPTR